MVCFISAASLPQQIAQSGRAASVLHLFGAMFRRTANPKLKPRKPLVFFIEGIFRVAIKKHKRFSNMGTDVKLLAAAC